MAEHANIYKIHEDRATTLGRYANIIDHKDYRI